MTRSVRRPVLALVLLLLTGTLVGCSELFAPRNEVQVPEDQLTIVQVADNAPPLMETSVTFWAVRGEARAAEIRYEAGGAYPNGKCLRFVVPAQSLLRHPDGRLVAQGDSVRITIRVLDPNLFLFDFGPSRVIFDPAIPARLEIRYTWADLDKNGDGLIDLNESNLSLWRQEGGGDPWVKVPTTRLESVQEIHANITSFTRYALAAD